jgi:hypothetical protein
MAGRLRKASCETFTDQLAQHSTPQRQSLGIAISTVHSGREADSLYLTAFRSEIEKRVIDALA